MYANLDPNDFSNTFPNVPNVYSEWQVCRPLSCSCNVHSVDWHYPSRAFSKESHIAVVSIIQH